MAQDKVQLKREEVVGNDVVLEDIYPKTSTNSVEDSSKGVPLDQTLAMIKNMINNKLSRVVNSVNGKTGVVVIDAGDVGLGNVDNVSFGDIKRWVIDYMAEVFGTKRIILREYLSEIHTITGTNDQAYADVPFYTQKGNDGTNDHMAYIGYIYWDAEHEMLQEEHLQINVVGYVDETLIYNRSVGGRDLTGGGLGVKLWSQEDVLKIKDAAEGGGLYIDKDAIVTNVLFFDGIYGTLTGTGTNMRNENALVYWSNIPYDTTFSNIPLIEIKVNGVDISRQASSGDAPNALHTQQTLKPGDVIISNFAWKDEYIDSDSQYASMLYPGMCDSLTSRQPAIGRVTQVADMTTNRPYIVEFFTCKPNVAHGLKLLRTNHNQASTPDDTLIGVDELNAGAKMSDGSNIYGGWTSNISGINILDKQDIDTRTGQRKDSPKKLRTVYPTGKSNDILSTSSGMIESESTFILPNFSLCVIPGYEFAEADLDSGSRPISNWNASSPFVGETANKCFDDYKWNMLGINLEKVIFDTATTSTHAYARNISGLRVNYDTDELHESWFGFGTDTASSLYDLHSGGLSVNVGDFLGIGTATELASETPALSSAFYDEGKVNVRIDKMKGLTNVGGNRLGINLADGSVYNPPGHEDLFIPWREGGLKFVDPNSIEPTEGPLAVNTGGNSTGLSVKNDYLVDTIYATPNVKTETVLDNVLAVQPFIFRSNITEDTHIDVVEVHTGLNVEDILRAIPVTNTEIRFVWSTETELGNDMERGYFIIDPNGPDPVTVYFDDDHTYAAAGKLFIYDSNAEAGSKCKPYFVFHSDLNEYSYLKTLMDSVDQSASTELARKRCHILITDALTPDRYHVMGMIYVPEQPGIDDLRVPDLNHDGKVDGSDSSTILGFFGKTLTDVYSNLDPVNEQWFTDPSLTTPVVPEVGRYYQVLNDNITDPYNQEHTYCVRLTAVESHGSVVLTKCRSGNHVLTPTDYMNMDVDRNGFIDARDSSHVLSFYSKMSTGVYADLTLNEAWRSYLREYVHINVEPASGTPSQVVNVIDHIYEKGVRVRYDTFKGLTSSPEYAGLDETGSMVFKNNDMHNALGIKIADVSAGFCVFDPTKSGGLRFGSEGYLSVRVNEESEFIAPLPNRSSVGNFDILNIGTKGLHIYNGNVLGVQLTQDGQSDNGDLRLDEHGCLRLSTSVRPNTHSLTISGENSGGAPVAVRYDGSADIEIELGPGLCFASST